MCWPHPFQGLDSLPSVSMIDLDFHRFSKELNGPQDGAAVLGEQARSESFAVIPLHRKKKDLFILQILVDVTVPASFFLA